MSLTTKQRALLQQIQDSPRGYLASETPVSVGLVLEAKGLVWRDASGTYHVSDAGREALLADPTPAPARYTPSPWTIGAMESGRVAVDGANGTEVTGWVSPADGALIAAAPDLASALLRAYKLAEDNAPTACMRAVLEACEVLRKAGLVP